MTLKTCGMKRLLMGFIDRTWSTRYRLLSVFFYWKRKSTIKRGYNFIGGMSKPLVPPINRRPLMHICHYFGRRAHQWIRKRVHTLYDHTLYEQHLQAQTTSFCFKTPHPTNHWTYLCESSTPWPEMETCHVWWVNSPHAPSHQGLSSTTHSLQTRGLQMSVQGQKKTRWVCW